MNPRYWTTSNLYLRVVLNQCFLNILGETHAATISQPDEHDRILVSYGNKTIRVPLHEISPLGDTGEGTSLFYFGDSLPDCEQGTLVVPAWGETEDDDDQDHD